MAVFFIVAMFYMRYLKKNPEKNPNIFIFRVLGKVYDGLAKLISLISFGVTWVLVRVLYAVTTVWKWLKTKLEKKKKPSKEESEREKE